MLNLIRNTVSNFRLTKAKQDANNFLAAAGITGQVQSQAIYNLVNDLQTSGLWSKMKAVYPMVTDNRNLLSYTEDFANVTWSKGGGTTVTANSTTAPDGTTTADTIILPNTGTIAQSLTNATNTQTTFSIYLRASANTTIKIGFFSPGTVVTCNVTTEWQRFSITHTYSATAYPQIYNDTGATVTLFAWGAQAEYASTPTQYQPILTTPSAFMASQMKYNLKDARDLDAAFRLTWSGGWTYSATGATPNGTNAYADTKYSPNSYSSNGVNYGIYTRNTATGTYPILMGGYNNDSKYFYVGGGGESYLGAGASAIIYSGLTSGYYIRNGNSAGQIAIKNNTLIGTNTSAAQYTTTNIYLAAINTTGSGASNFSNGQICFSHFSESLTQQEGFLLNQIVEKYQVALSRGVQAAQSFYYNSAYSNEANTYLYSTQITGTTQVSAINTLINGLKANNLWTKMKAVYPFVTDYRNLLAYTEDFSNAVWTKVSSTVSTNVVNAPNGTLTADKLIETAVADQHIAFTQNNANTGSIYTFSAYLKAAERNYGVIQIVDSSASNKRFTVLADLTNGTILTTRSLNSPTNTSSSIQDAGNGWYRITCTMAQTGGTICYTNVGISSTATPTWNGNDFPTYLGVASNGIYVWGAQCELGTSASDYQPVLAANNYATNVAAQMKFNLVNPQDTDAAFRLAFSGGWTYSTNGAQPNGTNGYADTKLVPNTDLTLNNSSFSIYSRTAFTPLTNQSWGVTSSGSFLPIIGATIDTTTRINGFSYSYMSPDVMNSATGLNFAAMFLLSRTSATSAKLFRNITQLASTSTQGQVSQPTTTFTFGALRNSASFQDYNNFQYGFAHISNGLSDAEIIIFYQLVQQFQTNLTRQV
jgi:hypothetical protein